MVLKESTIKEIKIIKDDYEEKNLVADLKFMEEVLEILKKEPKFYWKLKYHFGDYTDVAFLEKGELYFNIKKLLKKCQTLSVPWLEFIPEIKESSAINLFVLYSLFHESAHLFQLSGGFSDSEVNRFYKDLYYKFEHLSIFQFYKYLRKPLAFCFERHANLDSYRELARIYDDTPYQHIPESSYMVSLDYGLSLSPVEDTINYLKIRNDYDFSNLSLIEGLEFGARIDDELLNRANDINIEYSRDDINYKKAREKLKELR